MKSAIGSGGLVSLAFRTSFNGMRVSKGGRATLLESSELRFYTSGRKKRPRSSASAFSPQKLEGQEAALKPPGHAHGRHGDVLGQGIGTIHGTADR
jgi:hypothetical protein